MRGLFIIFLSLLTACSTDPSSQAGDSPISTFILVRHAEKDTIGSDPPLSEKGQARARAMRDLLTNTEIDRIFTSDYRRTRQTAEVVGEGHDLQVDQYDAGQLEGFAELLRSEHAGETVFIAGHSNTTPALLNILSGTSEYQTLTDSAYGDVFVLTTQGGQNHLLHLRAGQ